nr:immunoglobulin heavy chain junction region [Macaca mulatta]
CVRARGGLIPYFDYW